VPGRTRDGTEAKEKRAENTDQAHPAERTHENHSELPPRERKPATHEKKQRDEPKQDAKRSGEAMGTQTIRAPAYESEEVDNMDCGEEVDEDINDATDVQTLIRRQQDEDSVSNMEWENHVSRGTHRR
jgi:hypothetical protein